MALSNLGIFHTLIGVATIIAGATGFIRNGKIDLDRLTGKIYFYGTLLTSLTALGLSKQGGFNPGHIFALFIVVLILAAYFLYARKYGNNRARFIENFLFSFSFFLSLVPTINETFTRVPVGRPLAKAPTDPVITQTLLVLFVLFIIGCIYQIKKQRKINNSLPLQKNK
jgi:uncharacterized membrane protein